jgi:hypothetical protein
MFRTQNDLNSAPNVIPLSVKPALQYIAPSPSYQYGNEYDCYRQQQQALLVPASFTINQTSTKRGQRAGPLSISGKIKAAAVRRRRACFRCALLKISVCQKLTRNLLSHPITDNNPFNSATKIGHVQNAKRLLSFRVIQES